MSDVLYMDCVCRYCRDKDKCDLPEDVDKCTGQKPVCSDDRTKRRIVEMEKIKRDGTSTEFDNGYKKALMIIEAVRTELAMGTQHFNLKGDLITDELEIIRLMKNNQLTFVPANPERFDTHKKI